MRASDRCQCAVTRCGHCHARRGAHFRPTAIVEALTPDADHRDATDHAAGDRRFSVTTMLEWPRIYSVAPGIALGDLETGGQSGCVREWRRTDECANYKHSVRDW